MNKRLIGMILGAALVIGGFLYFTQPSTNDSSSKATNHVVGQGSTGVVLLEYGDFQCPACKSFYPVVKDIKAKYEQQIYVQFRHYPLEAIHSNARAAARAAEAAHKQGKFWEMHDVLYENQDAWKDASDPITYFKAYAQQVGVTDLTQFEADYRSSEVNDIINADLKEGQKLSITATPTFVLDGKLITTNPSSAEEFYKLIDAAIASKTTN